ncbi:hypothetical protein [Streptomyces bauhiniae]|uniref:hypothetical protein n=1 Tax=Streptomyces bauhiniae TaxID=2340725 RepID=UPI00365904B5
MPAPAYQLIVSPFLGEYLVLRPGDDNGVQIPLARYLELSRGASTGAEDEHLVSRHADYAPGSPDLSLIARALVELQDAPCPNIELKRAEDRWSGYAGPAGAGPFVGDTLLHTDLAPDNVLVNDRAHLVDWAWPTRGAAWIDPAVLILRLMDAGHTAEAADAWSRERFRSWATAPHAAVTAFGEANARTWDEIARNDPQNWKRRMALHAHAWLTYWRAPSK